MGIDVHKESWQVTAISEGEELFHGRIPGDYSALRKLLNRFVDCQIRVAYKVAGQYFDPVESRFGWQSNSFYESGGELNPGWRWPKHF